MVRSFQRFVQARRETGQRRFQEREAARQRNGEQWAEVIEEWNWEYIQARVRREGCYEFGSRRSLLAEMAETIRDTGGFAAALTEVAREQGLELVEHPGSGWISSPSYILHPTVSAPPSTSPAEYPCPFARADRRARRAD